MNWLRRLFARCPHENRTYHGHYHDSSTGAHLRLFVCRDCGTPIIIEV